MPEVSESGDELPQRGNFGDVLAKLFSRVTLAVVANEVLGLSVEVEQALSDVLSNYLGRDTDRVQYLSDRVIGFVPYKEKIDLLAAIIDGEGWLADFPGLIETLHKLRDYRNKIAHSYADSDSAEHGSSAMVLRKTYRRGREVPVRIDGNEFADLSEQGRDIVTSGFMEIFRRTGESYGSEASTP